MEVFSKEQKEELRSLIKDEVAIHLGQIKDSLYVSFLTHLQDEIRADQLSGGEKSGLAEYFEPEKAEEVEIDTSGCENVVVKCYEPSPEEMKIIIGDKVDAKIDAEKVGEPKDE